MEMPMVAKKAVWMVGCLAANWAEPMVAAKAESLAVPKDCSKVGSTAAMMVAPLDSN